VLSAVPDVAATEHRAEAVEALEASAEPAMTKTSQGDDMVASRDKDTKDGMAEDDEAAQAIARAEEVGSGGPSVRVHIASFRSEEGAERGWQKLRRNHAELLGVLDLQVRRINLARKSAYFTGFKRTRSTTSKAPRNFANALSHADCISPWHFSDGLVPIVRLVAVEHAFQRLEVLIGEAVHVARRQLARRILANLLRYPL